MSGEQVVLLSPDGRPCGAMSKAAVHGPDTPLHLGFSCWVFDRSGRLLITRRATTKRSFGGLWTNTVCGHPAPGESHVAAVRRRAGFELGLMLGDVVVALPDFRYRAEYHGLVENELCPVFLARTDDQPVRCVDEVEDLAWWSWARFAAAQAADAAAFSPWCRAQAPLLQAGSLLNGYVCP